MIFNAEMVRAILTAGRRRPGDLSNGNRLGSLKLVSVKTVANGRGAKMQKHDFDFWHPCPFGSVGDRIWVRERFRGHCSTTT